MSIKSKIQALITAANATTGESDTTLTDAVQTLVDGYGQGGGTQITKDEWTLTSDINTTTQGFYYGQNGTTGMLDRTFNGLQLFHFENNEAADHKAIWAALDNVAENTTAFCAFRIERASGTRSWNSSSAGVEFKMSAGTTVTRYKMDYQGV